MPLLLPLNPSVFKFTTFTSSKPILGLQSHFGQIVSIKSLGMMNCTGIKVCTSSLSLEKGIQKYTCERRGVKFPTYGQRSQPKGFKVHPSTWVHMLKFGFQTIFLGKSTQWPSKLSRFKLPGLLQKTSYFCSFVFHQFLQWKKTK